MSTALAAFDALGVGCTLSHGSDDGESRTDASALLPEDGGSPEDAAPADASTPRSDADLVFLTDLGAINAMACTDPSLDPIALHVTDASENAPDFVASCSRIETGWDGCDVESKTELFVADETGEISAVGTLELSLGDLSNETHRCIFRDRGGEPFACTFAGRWDTENTSVCARGEGPRLEGTLRVDHPDGAYEVSLTLANCETAVCF